MVTPTSTSFGFGIPNIDCFRFWDSETETETESVRFGSEYNRYQFVRMPLLLTVDMPDLAHAQAVDERLVRSRQDLAAFIISWKDRNNLSFRDVEALSRAASGRVRISGNALSKVKAAAEGAYNWHPQAVWFVGIAELNQLIVEVNLKGAPVPPGLPKELIIGKEPMRRCDGAPLEIVDLFAMFTGMEPVPGPRIQDLEAIERLATCLGPCIEVVFVRSGKSVIRDMDTFLSYYPHDRERLRSVIYGQGNMGTRELFEALPDIAFCLSEFTGTRWSREDLLALPQETSVSLT